MRNIFFTFIIAFFASACATAPGTLPEKYNLDNSLEPIEEISAVKSPSFELVDNQSIILRVNWDEYYLLVLRRPVKTRDSNPSIGIDRVVTGVTSGITSGHDRIYLDSSPGQYYVIDIIYKLKGEKQAEEIKERLRDK